MLLCAGVRPQSKVAPSGVVAGVRPRSKVASDCTSAPDPRPAGSTWVVDPRPAGFTWGVDLRAAGFRLGVEPEKEDSVLFL